MAGRKIATLAIALCLAAAGLAPVARADSQALVIRGDRSAVMDFSFTEPVTFRDQAVEVRGAGQWAGLVIEPIGHQPPFASLAALRVRAIHGNGELAQKFAGMTQFEPGRYRVRLLTDGPVELVLHVTNGGRVLKPTRRISVTVKAGQADVQGVLSRASVHLPGAVPAGRRALVLHSVSGLHQEDTRVCLITAGTCQRRLLPSPAPDGPDLLVPQSATDGAVMSIEGATSTKVRAALLTTEGVRLEPGTIRLFSLAYS